MLKGRMAETLFEELIRQSGNIVYRFGYEAIVQNLTQLEEKFDRYSEVGERIRAIPDFIVIDKAGKPEFVEVKFRWKPELHEDDYKKLEKIEKLWSPKIVFVNCWEQPYFRISEPPYVKNKKLVTKTLLDEKNWKIDKELYDEYESLVHRYLTPTLVPPKN
ncbi:MAG: hypothetical protein UY26_C0002G0105 [Candidatus Jorgensenbacteria bacterium GW2011_GWA1_48_13]|uniref:Uncharacterized protein n=2 Tax=Candidatus Joergenseniibacteriota TaxID=1752739 RepID=A0A0G1W9C7_9BACT|nr:MAG: hypothetical protein UY26_C0002G0105 [Candidatus Jorgensenbacteria bacterium GW2011_GWA1_48_13]KKU99211.1 MAG: hypothetical protein UY32_C0004G0003 [Candidatus Jorgensenbacteria bacterium GW2011_GWC1_48_8]KKW15406.1 MAG: hypothetical protein UY55_C0001G0160 [Candidatus Jorgensenbacteria bacterium GW2011_GWB1_50_10]